MKNTLSSSRVELDRKSVTAGGNRIGAKIVALQEFGESYRKKIKFENDLIKQLEAKVSEMEMQIQMERDLLKPKSKASSEIGVPERKLAKSTSSREELTEKPLQNISARILHEEKQLNKLKLRCNNTKAQNRQLREKINSLRKEKLISSDLSKKLSEEYLEKEKKFNSLIIEADEEYKKSHEASHKLKKVKEDVENINEKFNEDIVGFQQEIEKTKNEKIIEDEKKYEAAFQITEKEHSTDCKGTSNKKKFVLREGTSNKKKFVLREGTSNKKKFVLREGTSNKKKFVLTEQRIKHYYSLTASQDEPQFGEGIISSKKAELEQVQEEEKRWERELEKKKSELNALKQKMETNVDSFDQIVESIKTKRRENEEVANEINIIEKNISDVDEKILKLKGFLNEQRSIGISDSNIKRECEEFNAKIEGLKKNIHKYQLANAEANKTVNSLKIGIRNIYDSIGCSQEKSEDAHIITETNMLHYLGAIEERTNEILQMYDLCKKKEPAKPEDNNPPAPGPALTETDDLKINFDGFIQQQEKIEVLPDDDTFMELINSTFQENRKANKNKN